MLIASGIRKRLGGQQVLDELELACEAGSITVIAGANGSGKTTLLRIVAGVLEPDAGVVEAGGVSLAGRRARARTGIGYVPEAANPPAHLTVDELLALVASLRRAQPLAAGLRAALGVEPLRHHRIERLSLGERRRACLAAALVGDPTVLILDEPTNGLDDDGIATLRGLLVDRAGAGATVLIATHDRDFADAIGARVLHMKNGRLEEAAVKD